MIHLWIFQILIFVCEHCTASESDLELYCIFHSNKRNLNWIDLNWIDQGSALHVVAFGMLIILTVPNTHPTVRLCCDLEVEEDSQGDTETEPYEHGPWCEDTECIHSHHQPIVGKPAICIHDGDCLSCPHLNSEGALEADPGAAQLL